MPQKMISQLLFGSLVECQKVEFLICEKTITGGLLEQLDLVDQIQKYFIGFERANFHQNEVI
jgi:hypothetical protein